MFSEKKWLAGVVENKPYYQSRTDILSTQIHTQKNKGTQLDTNIYWINVKYMSSYLQVRYKSPTTQLTIKFLVKDSQFGTLIFIRQPPAGKV